MNSILSKVSGSTCITFGLCEKIESATEKMSQWIGLGNCALQGAINDHSLQHFTH